MHRILIIVCLFLFYSEINAQPILRQSIGVGALPLDNSPVCKIPWYLGGFYQSGLQSGDTAFDFILYDSDGKSLNLKNALSKGRPVLLIASSYTCPVYRGLVPVINDVVKTYSGKVDVYIIYTIEAHPDKDTSVYYGYVQTGATNIKEGILYRQPTTYGARKAVVKDMLAKMTTNAPVFIDGPCNNWWSTYGPAPNNAYLIDTTGIIISKHGWFHRYPDNVYCDIDSVLGTKSGKCKAIGGKSDYTFKLTSKDSVNVVAGTTLSVDGELKNTGTEDILIYARKIENDMPVGWASSMCIDVCYSTTTDSVVFLLAAGTTQPVHVYFYTSSVSENTGHVKMGFKNMSNPNNKNSFDVYGISSFTNRINTIKTDSYFSISPNPVNAELKIYIWTKSNFQIQIFNTIGEQIIELSNKRSIDVSKLKNGIYLLRIKQGNNYYVQRFTKQ